MPAKFEKLGIAFQYPDNWTLEEEGAQVGRGSVTVYSPGGAFWSVTIHPQDVDPNDLARAAVHAMKDEYREIEAERIAETIAGHRMIGYDLSFYCLDMISTASVRSLRTGRATYTVFCQAEDRDFDKLGAVFQAITVSLLEGIRGPAGQQ
jgi:hypothetical protein